MVKAQQATPNGPLVAPVDVLELRVKLIAEELCEFAEAVAITMAAVSTRESSNAVFAKRLDSNTAEVDLVKAYDAILDLLVVVIGAAVALGLDIEPGWQEVHRSNMSKFLDGYRREDGKWVKGPSYSPAELKPILCDQIEAAKTKAAEGTLPLT